MNGPAQPPFDAGQTLGDFRLLRLVGEGGMGQVWEAEQLGLGRPVALKLVRPGFVTERTLALFAREARAGGRLHHPGLVSVHAYGETDGIAWIAMELVPDARTFQDVVAEAVREERPFREVARRVLTICARVADAIQAAHDVGVIHRDLKPQNILVTEDDEPRVVDFGLARILDETRLTQSGFFAGTCLYMSPEQIEGRQRLLDRRTDVFSLGVILYEALAGFHPFEGATLIEVAQRILHNEPRPLDDVRPSLSRDLAATVARCLEKDSDGRYPSMSALAADLRHLLANERVHPRRASAIRRALLWPRRHLDRVFMAVVTIAALVNGIQWRTVAAKERTDVRLQARLDLLRNWRAALEARTVIGPISEGDEDALDTLAEAVSDPVVEETEELHGVLRRRREQAGLRPVDAIRLEAAGEALELAREVRSALDDLGDLKSPLSLAGRAEIRSRWASIVRSWESSDAPTPRFDFYPLAQRGPGRACPRVLVLGTGRAPVWLEAEGRWAFDERTGVVVALLPRDERTSPPSRLYVQVTEWTSGVESRVGPGGGSWT
ncbi:MAG: serine/threonine-protein kinase, partial [Planctomycetota bacterium]